MINPAYCPATLCGPSPFHAADLLVLPIGYASVRTQIRNEQLSNIVRKVQGECDYVLKQAAAAAEKQETLAAQLAKLTKSLEQTEEKLKKTTQEAKVLPHCSAQQQVPFNQSTRLVMFVYNGCTVNAPSPQVLSNEASSVERTTQRIFQDVRSLEAELLRTLSEQTSAEKSSSKTAADIRSLRASAESEEMLIVEVQNELARLAVDALNTQGHNDRLRQALQLLDDELKDKVGLAAQRAE